jgi:hypothetical protein
VRSLICPSKVGFLPGGGMSHRALIVVAGRRNIRGW